MRLSLLRLYYTYLQLKSITSALIFSIAKIRKETPTLSTVYYFACFGSLNCIFTVSEAVSYTFCGPNAEIYDFLNHFDSVITNKFIYQSILVNNSAHYCIYFIHAMSIGIPFTKIVNILDKHQDPNNFVLNFVYNITN